MIYENETELLHKAKEVEGKTFGEIDTNHRMLNERAEECLGQIVEECFFGYNVNSKVEANSIELSIELKATPIQKSKNGIISAKELLVLNIINYQEEVNKSFETSSFWLNNKSLLLMFYEWSPEAKQSDYKILKVHLHHFSDEDLEIIKNDWNYIIDKIKSGKAHELSEGDTIYLVACLNGVDKNTLVDQSLSTIKAMPRAYSLKQSYVTTIAKKAISNQDMVSIVDANQLQNMSFEQLLNKYFSLFIGKSLNEIAGEFSIPINTDSKSFLQRFVSSLLGITGTSLNDIEEFSKANIQFKTIRLEPKGSPKEHMSFKNINFKEWVEEDWENSWLKQNFESTKYLFVIFEYKEREKDNPNRKLYFKGIKLWNMPVMEIENRLKKFWFDVKSILQTGVKFENKAWGSKVRGFNNLPSAGENGLCHIRPKARDASDKIQLPDGQYITKQALWLDREYIGDIIKDI